MSNELSPGGSKTGLLHMSQFWELSEYLWNDVGSVQDCM